MRGMRLAAALVATVVLAACGGDGESAAPTTTSTTPSPVQLDKQRAQRAVLSLADLPGYTEDAPDPDDEDQAVASADECVEANALLLRLGEDDDPRGAASADFGREAHTVSSSVTFAETDEEARQAIAVLNRGATITCLSTALTEELRATPGFTNVRVTSSKLPGVTAGDENVGYRLVTRGTAAGQAVTINLEFTFVRVGRGVSVLQSVSETSTFPAADRARLLGLIAGRLAA
ncbi:MAG: hypothetical protein ACLGI2_01595 [Acidimicrobiia bacterium]